MLNILVLSVNAVTILQRYAWINVRIQVNARIAPNTEKIARKIWVAVKENECFKIR